MSNSINVSDPNQKRNFLYRLNLKNDLINNTFKRVYPDFLDIVVRILAATALMNLLFTTLSTRFNR